MPNKAQHGRSIAPYEGPVEVVSVRMPPELKAKITRIADDEERSTSWMTRRLLEEAVAARARAAATRQVSQGEEAGR